MRQSKVYNYSEDEFRKIISESTSLTECCKKVGLSINGSNARDQIKKRCKELNIELKFEAKRDYYSHPKYTLDEILIENSPYTNRTALKQRLIAENRLEYKCQFCSNTGTWNNLPLTLELDHINGVNNDNRIENLRFLCPNCHSQTDTYSGKNK